MEWRYRGKWRDRCSTAGRSAWPVRGFPGETTEKSTEIWVGGATGRGGSGTREFVHTHGEDVASGGKAASDHGHGGGHGDHGEGQTFGPRIAFTHTFQEPGLYKIWAQLDHHGDIATVPFVVEVE